MAPVAEKVCDVPATQPGGSGWESTAPGTARSAATAKADEERAASGMGSLPCGGGVIPRILPEEPRSPDRASRVQVIAGTDAASSLAAARGDAPRAGADRTRSQPSGPSSNPKQKPAQGGSSAVPPAALFDTTSVS